MATPGGTKKNPMLVTRKSEMLRTHSRRITFSLSKSVSSSMPRMLDGSGMCVSVIISSPKARQPNKKAIESFKNSDNFKGDKETKKSIFDRFKNYFN